MASKFSGAALAPLLLLSVLASPASAQELRGWGIKGGLIGGYETFTYVSGTTVPAIPRSLSWGFSAGIFAEFLNGGVVNFVLDGAYIQKGRKVTSEEVARSSGEPGYLSAGAVGTPLRLGYLTFAVSFKVRMRARGSTPYFFLGPRFDFLVARSSGTPPLFDHYRKMDIGVNIGIGMEFASRRHPALSFEGRWSPGFSRAFSNDIVGIKNMTVDVLAAVWF